MRDPSGETGGEVMKRPLFNIRVAVSLLPCAAFIFLWVRGYITLLVSDWALHCSGPAWNAADVRLHFLGFWYERHETYTRRMWEVAIPLWAITAIVAAPAAYWILRRRTAHPTGHCTSCGYDLRATPDRCPECGTIPAKATA
jgi:hypothetical protein